MMNKKEKPWDSFVLFAPEKMMEQDTEDYFFYGSDEYITLSKDKLNDKPPEIVKCVVTRREGVPNQIAVYDDMSCSQSGNMDWKNTIHILRHSENETGCLFF